MFTLKFSTDNAAFEEDHVAEIMHIFSEVSKKINRYQSSGAIRDSNGNTIGQWRLDND